MRLLRCPKQESLLELVSVPAELSAFRRASLKGHIKFCKSCREATARVEASVRAYFTPEPDITSSLLKVYNKLQNDETLILRGWKLNESRQTRDARYWLFQRGYLFRGSLAFGVLALLISVFATTQSNPVRQDGMAAVNSFEKPPLATIRIEDRNSVKVHYVQPELLQSTEFETTSAR